MRPYLALLAGAMVLAGLAACEHKPSKEEEEAVKNTFACQLAGQRMVSLLRQAKKSRSTRLPRRRECGTAMAAPSFAARARS